MAIELLPEDLINKIAAGEVVERPASVIKELVENSIDAKAKHIIVELEDSGTELIKVKDDGLGMNKDDAKRSTLRHATSKIKTSEDLFNIQSLGFRGEALASISAVSKFTLITKQENSLEGYKIQIDGGKLTGEGICAATTGTTIEVRELFWNVPARKKFLKTASVELRHCIDIVSRYALLHHNISFKLIHNKRLLLHAPATDDTKQNSINILGRDLNNQLLEVDFEDKELGIKINGYIGKPLAAKTDKSAISFFVNNRYVKNQTLANALYDAYHSLLFVGRHPVAVLKLDVDPKTIDVNVHPQKTEIKIEQKDLIYALVKKAVENSLHQNSLVPTDDVKATQVVLDAVAPRPKLPDLPKYQFEKAEQTVFEGNNKENTNYSLENNVASDFVVSESLAGEKENLQTSDSSNHVSIGANETSFESNIIPQTNTNYAQIEANIKLPQMRILGQIHKTFFIAETPGGMLLIDQHVVQERVLYEKFMTEYLNKHVAVQELLNPELLSLSSMQTITVLQHLATLKELGFDLEHFGGNDFSLRSCPSIFGKVQVKDLLYKVIEELNDGKVKEMTRIQEEIITMMACRASVKAGDVMTIPQITKLLQELSECKLPYTCPHGRAILIKITADDLEKKFLRHG